MSEHKWDDGLVMAMLVKCELDSRADERAKVLGEVLARLIAFAAELRELRDSNNPGTETRMVRSAKWAAVEDAIRMVEEVSHNQPLQANGSSRIAEEFPIAERGPGGGDDAVCIGDDPCKGKGATPSRGKAVREVNPDGSASPAQLRYDAAQAPEPVSGCGNFFREGRICGEQAALCRDCRQRKDGTP